MEKSEDVTNGAKLLTEGVGLADNIEHPYTGVGVTGRIGFSTMKGVGEGGTSESGEQLINNKLPDRIARTT